MSAEITNVSEGIITIRITGKLNHAEFAATQKQAGEIIKQMGKVRLLALLEDFEGTERGGDWGDVSFQVEFDDFIEKIAIVGDPKWEGVTALFTGKGIRRIPIEFFETAALEKARAWIAA
jgi:hypothetical protein